MINNDPDQLYYWPIYDRLICKIKDELGGCPTNGTNRFFVSCLPSETWILENAVHDVNRVSRHTALTSQLGWNNQVKIEVTRKTFTLTRYHGIGILMMIILGFFWSTNARR